MNILVVLQTHSKGDSQHYLGMNKNERFVKQPKGEITRRCTRSLVETMNYAKELFLDSEFELVVFDDHSDESTVNEIKNNNILKPGIIKQTDVNDHLSIIQSNIISITDSIAPIKCIKIKQKDYYPWVDAELKEIRDQRNFYFNLKNNYDENTIDKKAKANELYVQFRSMFQKLNRIKMTQYYAKKSIKDFKNSKNFWKFYSASIKIRSDKATNFNDINIMDLNHNLITAPIEFSNKFNSFFTNLSSESLASKDECNKYIFDNFKELKENNKMKTSIFEFKKVSISLVDKLLKKLDTSCGPGVSGISTKILKAAHEELAPSVTELFNKCIETKIVPNEWKLAKVTPLYKLKGIKTDLNNYRDISVLPPLGKLFEKVRATQIIIYFNMNNLFFNGQHGFRAFHSCESALHELISFLNETKNKKLIALLLFIDFKKAFDLVDSDLLIKKLFHYGFSNDSLDLIKNYFFNRQQKVKVKDSFSDLLLNLLGVPQGSVLGPLFFIIFINDLAFLLKDLMTKLFADDTTLIDTHDNMDILITKFKKKLEILINWCKFNKLDINWAKTDFMFVTNKRIKAPKEIEISAGISVRVVEQFKLLGVTIDNKLNFETYASMIKKSVNRKLYSIKRLFYLCQSVKLQFFKSFIMPHFDYCSTLFCYFPKATLQKIYNTYNYIISKLLNLNASVDSNNFNVLLENYGLNNFQHRLFIRMATFIHNIVNIDQAPKLLKDQIKMNLIVDKGGYNLRNKFQVNQPLRIYNHYGESTFVYFYSKFINNFILNDLKINSYTFKKLLYNNLNNHFVKLC
jgi:hypothetical protein